MPERIKSFKQFADAKVNEVLVKPIHKPLTDERKADQAFYDSARWKRCRRLKLRMNPVCQCEDNCRQPATEVHHIINRKERPDLAYDLDNLQSMTKSCHSKLTVQYIREKKKEEQ